MGYVLPRAGMGMGMNNIPICGPRRPLSGQFVVSSALAFSVCVCSLVVGVGSLTTSPRSAQQPEDL